MVSKFLSLCQSWWENIATFTPQKLKTPSALSQLPGTLGQRHCLGWHRQTHYPELGIWSHSCKETYQWWQLWELGRSDSCCWTHTFCGLMFWPWFWLLILPYCCLFSKPGPLNHSRQFGELSNILAINSFRLKSARAGFVASNGVSFPIPLLINGFHGTHLNNSMGETFCTHSCLEGCPSPAALRVWPGKECKAECQWPSEWLRHPALMRWDLWPAPRSVEAIAFPPFLKASRPVWHHCKSLQRVFRCASFLLHYVRNSWAPRNYMRGLQLQEILLV